MLAGKLRDEPIHFRLRLGGCNAFLQSPDDLQVMRAAMGGIAAECKGPPDVNRLAVSYAVVFVAGVLRARRHHARDGKRLGIERDLPPDDVGIGGKTVAPQPVAQNRLLSVAGDLVVGVELMPARGVESQHVEKPGSHLEACEALRLAGAGKLQIGARETGQGFEGTIARAKIAKVERVQRKLGVAG